MSLRRLRSSAVDFFQITAVPRLADDRPDLVRARRLQIASALAGAHARGSLVLSAWVRGDVGPSDPALRVPLAVILGGDHGFPTATGSVGRGGRQGVLFPPGAEGVPLPGTAAIEILDGFPCWSRCLGQHDALACRSRAVGDPPEPTPFALFEHQLAHLGTARFAWVVIAEPVSQVRLDDRRREISVAMAGLGDRAQQAGLNRLQLERAEDRLRDYLRNGVAGFWQVHVLVGAAAPEELAVVAPILCAGAELEDLPYLLLADSTTGRRSLDEVLQKQIVLDPEPGVDPPWACPASPFLAGPDLLSAIVRPPERELYGVRMALPHRFDITPENDVGVLVAAARDPDADDLAPPLELGDLLDDSFSACGPLRVSRQTLNRHTLVCGSTGAGKSQTIRHLLEELTAADIPWLVIEPAKSEYRGMAGRLRARFLGKADVTVLRLGDPAALPALLNPLEPEPGFPLQTHVDFTIALFLAAFEAEEPFPQVLAEAMRRSYEQLGWDLALGEYKPAEWAPRTLRETPRYPTYPTLGELQATARQVVREVGYGEEITRNVLGFVDVRLGSLRLGTSGRFFEGGHPVDMAGLLRRNIVVEIEDVGRDQDKAFVIGTMLIRLVERLRLDHTLRDEAGEAVSLRHVTVIEEAHRLLRRETQSRAAVHAVETFASLLAEVRAYGEGLIVAEQIPTKVLPDVVKNTALQVVHRLPAADDREMVGAAMNLTDEQSEFVVSLEPGVAVVFAEGMDRSMLVRVPLGEHEETSEGCRTDVPLRCVRSRACPSWCAATPCRLDHLARAMQLARRAPGLVLWIEFLIVAHITGNPDPSPRPELLAGLVRDTRRVLHGAPTVEAQSRLLECAMSWVVQSGVDRRRAILADSFDPGAFAERLRDRATSRLWPDGRSNDHYDADPEWQAGRYRFIDVWRQLKGSSVARGRPLEERGLQLPDGSEDDQAEFLARRHPLKSLAPLPLLHGTTTYPVIDPIGLSPIEQAAVALRPATAMDKRLDLAAGSIMDPESTRELVANLKARFENR